MNSRARRIAERVAVSGGGRSGLRLRIALATLAAAGALAGSVLAAQACVPAHARAAADGESQAPAGSALTGSALTGSALTGSALTGDPIPAAPEAASSFWSLTGNDPRAEALSLLASMGPEERLGQLFMLSYAGVEPTSLLYDWIRLRGLGGVKIFGWNADDTRTLAGAIRAIQAAALQGPRDIPPFVATDQEGGWIRHVKGGTSVTPGNMAIGASAWPTDAYESAYYIGVELSALGVTMNFAPTVDLATRPDSTIIGPRAFSTDPNETAVLAAAWARGMADAGVAATAKHFPGHGDTALDSHGTLPVIKADAETLWNRELVPYRVLAAEGVAGVMSGHLAFPEVTGSLVPASLSPELIQGFLRGRIGYDGLVITDDLMMAGAASPGGLSETCERAIRAGNDVLMFSRTLALDENAWGRLLSLYRRDESFRARVDESARRVLEAKIRWLLPRGRDGVGPAPDPESSMRSPDSRAFFSAQALRSATLVGAALPPPADSPRVLVAGQFSEYFAAAARVLPSSSSFRFSYLPAERAVASELDAFRARLASADAAVVCVANQASAEFARAALAAGKRLYVVSAMSPIFAVEFAGRGMVVAVYSYAAESFGAAFAVLSGAAPAPGRLPLRDGAP